MGLLERIEREAGGLAASEAKVARAVLDHQAAVGELSITRLAEDAGTSTSAVQRFCQSMGFAGYKDFRYALLSERRGEAAPGEGDLVARVTGAISGAVGGIAGVDRRLLARLTEQLVGADRVFCVGVHRSALPALKLRMELEDLGVVALAGTDPAGAGHLSGLVTGSSCAVQFSVAGSKSPLRGMNDGQVSIPELSWLVTSNPRARANAEVENVVVLPQASERTAWGAEDHVVMMAFVEVVTALVRERVGTEARGF